jgi:NitT/TauT family transport system permease protein
MRRCAAALVPTLFVALLFGAWEAACRLLAVPTAFLPTPSEIAVAFAENAPLLLLAAWRTLETALVAFLMVFVLASIAAVGAASSQIMERSFRPIAVTLQVTPAVALAPLFAVWAGIEHPERAVVAMAGVVAFFPIYAGVLSGLQATDPELERLFDLYGATGWQRLIRLRAPSAVPQGLQGMKVALGLALVGAVIGEMNAAGGGSEGLAWRILEASHRLEMAKSFAALVALALLGGGLYVGFQALERSALAWWRGRPSTRR